MLAAETVLAQAEPERQPHQALTQRVVAGAPPQVRLSRWPLMHYLRVLQHPFALVPSVAAKVSAPYLPKVRWALAVAPLDLEVVADQLDQRASGGGRNLLVGEGTPGQEAVDTNLGVARMAYHESPALEETHLGGHLGDRTARLEVDSNMGKGVVAGNVVVEGGVIVAVDDPEEVDFVEAGLVGLGGVASYRSIVCEVLLAYRRFPCGYRRA